MSIAKVKEVHFVICDNFGGSIKVAYEDVYTVADSLMRMCGLRVVETVSKGLHYNEAV